MDGVDRAAGVNSLVSVDAAGVAAVVATTELSYGKSVLSPKGLLSWAYNPAYVVPGSYHWLGHCTHTLPAGRRPPPAMFRCAVIQMQYVDLYMFLIQDPDVCDDDAAAAHAECLVIMSSQRPLHFTGRLARMSIDGCMPANSSIYAHFMTDDITTTMQRALTDCPYSLTRTRQLAGLKETAHQAI